MLPVLPSIGVLGAEVSWRRSAATGGILLSPRRNSAPSSPVEEVPILSWTSQQSISCFLFKCAYPSMSRSCASAGEERPRGFRDYVSRQTLHSASPSACSSTSEMQKSVFYIWRRFAFLGLLVNETFTFAEKSKSVNGSGSKGFNNTV